MDEMTSGGRRVNEKWGVNDVYIWRKGFEDASRMPYVRGVCPTYKGPPNIHNIRPTY